MYTPISKRPKSTARIYTWLKDTMKIMWPFLIVIAGLFFCISGFTSLINEECITFMDYGNFKELCRWVGNLLIVGVLIGFLSSYFQFKSIYRKSLEEIIYSPDFLSRRKDIDKIWENVSNVLFDLKFPDIRDQLFYILRNKYFPPSHQHYQESRVVILNLSWEDEANEIIKIVQEDSFVLVTSNGRGKCDFSLNSTTVLSDKELLKEDEDLIKDSYNRMEEVIIDNKKIEESGYHFSTKVAHGMLHSLFSLDLENNKRYNIKLRTTKMQCLKDDDYIGLHAQTTINNLRLQVFNDISDYIDLNFIPRGVLGNFACTKKNLNYFEYEYKGLILHKQGYILTLRPHKE